MSLHSDVDISEANDWASRVWDGLDEAWREAFRQGWDAVRSGNIGVGACASTLGGEIIYAARNRINDQDGLLISRFRLGNPRLVGGFDGSLRGLGEGQVLDFAYELEDSGVLDNLLGMEVNEAIAEVWPRLQTLSATWS